MRDGGRLMCPYRVSIEISIPQKRYTPGKGHHVVRSVWLLHLKFSMLTPPTVKIGHMRYDISEINLTLLDLLRIFIVLGSTSGTA